MIYAFGTCTLDTDRYELRRAGMPCALEPHAVDVLAYLLEHRERVVTKQELLEQLWPNRVVGEAILAQRLMLIRKAIGDSGRSQHCHQDRARARLPLHCRRGCPCACIPRRLFGRSRTATPGPPGGADIPLADCRARDPCFRHSARAARRIGTRGCTCAVQPASAFRRARCRAGTAHTVVDLGAQRYAASRVRRGRGRNRQDGVGRRVRRPAGGRGGRLARSRPVHGSLRDGGTLSAGAGSLGAHVPWRRRRSVGFLPAPLRSQLACALARVLPPAEREALARSAHVVTPAQMLRELTDALEVLTATRPLVLVLEDLHWSDRATLAWLAYLAKRRDPARVLILGTYRTRRGLQTRSIRWGSSSRRCGRTPSASSWCSIPCLHPPSQRI